MTASLSRREILLTCLAASSASAAALPRPATPLEFRSLSGRQVNLAALKGKVVGVMFFSTDCSHCQHTTTLLSPLYDELHPKGLELCGLAVNPMAAGNLGDFKAKYKVKFPLGLATKAEWTRFTDMPATARAYVPHLVIVDRQGTVVEDHPGLDRDWWLGQETGLRRSFEQYL